jgi:D-alanine-D-alanine ligase
VRVAVLAGGRSSEHVISLASARAVRAGLEQAGHEALAIEIDRDGVWRHEGSELSVTPGRGLLGAAVAFPALHGPYGEDGVVQGLLECLGVPYVGAGVLASAVCMDKVVFKDLMARAGVPQVPYRAVRDGRWRESREDVLEDLEALGLPAFVKPARLGSSVGIAKAREADDLGPALDAAFGHDDLVIVEAMSDGLEVECSVLGSFAPVASLPGEISIEAEFYDYEAKYTPGGMDLVVPARIGEEVRERVRALALDTFTRAGCAGLARVDFFVEGEDVLVNELNTMPGFTETSVYAKLFEATGISYGELLDRLVHDAVEHHRRLAAYRH